MYTARSYNIHKAQLCRMMVMLIKNQARLRAAKTSGAKTLQQSISERRKEENCTSATTTGAQPPRRKINTKICKKLNISVHSSLSLFSLWFLTDFTDFTGSDIALCWTGRCSAGRDEARGCATARRPWLLSADPTLIEKQGTSWPGSSLVPKVVKGTVHFYQGRKRTGSISGLSRQ